MTSQLRSTNPPTLVLRMRAPVQTRSGARMQNSMMGDLAVTGLHGGGGGGGAGGDGGAVVVVVVVLLLLLPGRAGWCCCCSPKAQILVAILPQCQVPF